MFTIKKFNPWSTIGIAELHATAPQLNRSILVEQYLVFCSVVYAITTRQAAASLA